MSSFPKCSMAVSLQVHTVPHPALVMPVSLVPGLHLPSSCSSFRTQETLGKPLITLSRKSYSTCRIGVFFLPFAPLAPCISLLLWRLLSVLFSYLIICLALQSAPPGHCRNHKIMNSIYLSYSLILPNYLVFL